MLGPESHGSIRMEKVGDDCEQGREYLSLGKGEKVKRKVVSALRCLTVTDMTSGCRSRCSVHDRV